MARSYHLNGSLCKCMTKNLHLAGMRKPTHDGYPGAVRQLADYCKTSPDDVTEDQLLRFSCIARTNDTSRTVHSASPSPGSGSSTRRSRADATGRHCPRRNCNTSSRFPKSSLSHKFTRSSMPAASGSSGSFWAGRLVGQRPCAATSTS